MQKQDLEFAVEKFEHRAAFLQRAVEFLESQIAAPVKISDAYNGFVFRYANPNLNHFCLLHLLRVISCLNSLSILVKHGHTQEIAVLVRTAYEFILKVDYVLSGYYDPEQRDKVSKYLIDYFLMILAKKKD